jgi:hypothetical protein
LGPYPRAFAASRTRSLVSGAIRICGVSFNTCDTVVTETPAIAATSRMPTFLTSIAPLLLSNAGIRVSRPPRRSSFHGPKGEACDDVPLQHEGEQNDGDRVDRRERSHCAPVQSKLRLKVGYNDGRRLGSHRGE